MCVTVNVTYVLKAARGLLLDSELVFPLLDAHVT